MIQQYDILIKNARIRGKPESLVDIGIASGQIISLGENLAGEAEMIINADANLVTESYINPHLHLCKVYTLQMMDEDALTSYNTEGMGKAMNAIELAARVKEKYDETWIIKNVRKAVAQAALHGNTHIRAFADVDGKARLEGVRALIRAREEFKTIVDIQVCAFAQDGWVREPGTDKLMRQAMELGADVVGGIPWIEYTESDMQQHVKEVFDLAQEFNKDVSMLVDDAGDPGLRSLEMMIVEALRRGWQGRALAHHARAMGLYPQPYFQKIAALLKQAKMAVVSDPHTGPLHARVKELLTEGVTVCLGQDDISDAYYPFGRNNMLEVAFLAAHLLWMTTNREMGTLYDMVTLNPAQAMNINNHQLKVGSQANLVVLDAPNVLEALREHSAPSFVISHGKLIDRTEMETLARKGEWTGAKPA